MINTQKLTAFAFAFYDGYRSKRTNGRSPLSEDQEKQKVTDLPHPLEFLSYIFYFHGIIVGPLCFYRDYIDYIEGTNLKVIPNSSPRTSVTTTEPLELRLKQPSPFWPVLTKLAQCVIWASVLLFLTPKYTVEYNLSAAMLNAGWWKRLSYLLFSTFCTRGK